MPHPHRFSLERTSRPVLLILCLVLLSIALSGQVAFAVSPDIVISQVYGGGGNSGATYTHDFIEFFNRGSAGVSVGGWSVQYASATGTGNFGGTTTQITPLPNVVIAPGQYLLIEEAQGAGGTTPLPTPDVTDTTPINMSGTMGKVALATTNVSLGCNGGSTPCSPAALAMIVDLVGYGGANFFEGAGATPAPSNSTSVQRLSEGCIESDNNNIDFFVAAPVPRNSASPLHDCGNQPVIATCGATLNTQEGVAGSTTVSASDVDGVVVDIAITSITPMPSAGTISLSGLIPAGAVGDTASANVSVDALTPPGSYAVLITATNNDAVPQTGTCTLSVVVSQPAVSIPQIQGAAHRSPMVGLPVTTEGIVTAVVSNGFYLQDPVGDGDVATSDAIFVFVGSTPGISVVVGDEIRLNGNVQEFYPGGFSTGNLSITEITGPSVQLLSVGNPLPAATIIGTGGRIPPNAIITNDSSGDVETSLFDPNEDGIDFYESLEAMLVQVNNAIVVGPTNNFGEILVVGDNGANAGVLSPRGAIVIQPGDFNPERIMVDDGIQTTPIVNVGASFTAPIIGTLDYNFGNFRIQATAPLLTVPGSLAPETATPAGVDQLSIASFNVENLDPSDPPAKFSALASIIVNNLQSPDIIGLEEIQDNNGATNNGEVDASATGAALINAILAAGGPQYAYRDIPPVNNQDGGEPGGNIRVAFLFRTDRVMFVDRPGGTSTASTTAVSGASGVELSFSPGRIDPTNAAFNNSRKPLAAEFLFNGQQIIVIVNHFNSKGGDNPLFGRIQPPVLNSEVQRLQQAQVVNQFVNSVLAINPSANVVVFGDLNDFPFSTPVQTLAGGVLTNLISTLPLNEQYTYVFDGNAQVLDNFLVSGNLFTQVASFDVLHTNAEFAVAVRVTDHDSLLARFTLPPATPTPSPTATETPSPTPTDTPSATPSSTATATPPPYQLNLGHIECVNFQTEVHFVLLFVDDGITPGMLVYTYMDENSQSVSRSVSPSQHTGNVWHYSDYPFANGFIEVTSATVDVNGFPVSLHNPGEFTGTYNCAGTETPTPTETPLSEATPTSTPTLTSTFTPPPTNTPPPTPTFTPVPPTVNPLSACWVQHWNGTGNTEWRITNPNPVPILSVPDTKVRYNWFVYNQPNAQGNVIQSAQNWDNGNPNPVNTAYSQSIRLEWYLVTNGVASPILGTIIANADATGQCP